MNEDVTQISIKEFLESLGIPTRKEGPKYFASSPFSTDSNWSLCIYPTNTYFDWSSGHGGNILNLYSRLNNCTLSEAASDLRNGIKHEKFIKHVSTPVSQPERRQPFDYEKYTNKNAEECEAIKAYANSRGITEGYFCGVFFERDRSHRQGGSIQRGNEQNNASGWIRVPALGFLHVDKNLKPCGIKFRRIDKKEPRFSARGVLGSYILEVESAQQNDNVSFNRQSVLYVVESETSANSLWSFLKGLKRPCVILSRGGVASAPILEDIPEKYRNLARKVIIDYDGNEELYKQRIKLYEPLKAQPIKLILSKGEDINFLYCRGEIWKIENLLS